MKATITPDSLNRIYRKVNSARFRIRDVNTLMDYLCLNVTPYAMGDTIKFCDVLCCDNGYRESKCARALQYALISSQSEVEQMKRFKEERLIEFMKQSYKPY